MAQSATPAPPITPNSTPHALRVSARIPATVTISLSERRESIVGVVDNSL
jgi:hypothetical protein